MITPDEEKAHELKLTRHAITRLRQRGFRPSDVDLVMEFGTATHDGVLLSKKDVEREVAVLKRESRERADSEKSAELRRRIAEIERLNGTAVFMEEGVVVSVYRPCAVRCSRMIREGRSRVLGRRWWRQGRAQNG
jgi:hypothetical protein